MLANEPSDLLPVSALRQWSNDFLGEKEADPYSEPNRASSQWWQGLSGIAECVGVTAGGGEVLVDGIRETVQKMKDGWDGEAERFEYVEVEGECHDMALAGSFLGEWYLENSGSVRFARDWIVQRAVEA